MSRDHPDRPSSFTSNYPTAHGIIRSILDDDTLPTDISPSGELYRAIERFHAGRETPTNPRPAPTRHRRGTRWMSGASTPSNMSDDNNNNTTNPDSHRRRLGGDSRISHNPALDNILLGSVRSSSPQLPPLRSLNNRRVAALSSSNSPAALVRSLQSDRATNRLNSAMEAWTESGEHGVDSWDREWLEEEDIQDGMRGSGIPVPHLLSHSLGSPDQGRGESDHSPLRRLIDFTHTTPPDIPDLFASLPLQSPEEQTEEYRRVKRRKVDSDRLTPHFQGFQYGKYGQVESGQLKMELVSCDGGLMDSEEGAKYAAENMLKNDASVYCTGNPRCNIVLRHQGATVFTLKELIIKAPKSNFCSPVQAGMVFVSMASDHIFNRTAQYQIQYSTPRSSSRRREREAQRHGPIISIRHNEDGSTMTQAQQRARRLVNIGLDDEDNGFRVAQIPSEFDISSPHYHVDTDHSGDEEDNNEEEEDDPSLRPYGQLQMLSDDSSDSTDELSRSTTRARRFDAQASHRFQARRRREQMERSYAHRALVDAAEAAQIATQEAVRAVGGELMMPNARFYFERPRSKCTIYFDPPISGRYILLKMWNPMRHENANIDIQAVIAKGYAGPRFFPSVDIQ